MTKKLLIILLIIVIGGGAVIGGIFAWRYWQTLKQEVEPAEEEEPGVEVPADWKTYRNEEWGFEVKYPENWKLVSNAPNYQGLPSFETLDFSASPPKVRGARVSIFITQFKKELYKDWREQIREEGLAPTLYTTININNKECLKTTMETKKYNPIGGPERYEEQVSCANNTGTKIVILGLQCERLNKSEYIEIFNRILSTFEFTEKDEKTTNWIDGGSKTSPILVKPKKTVLQPGEKFSVSVKSWTFNPEGKIEDHPTYLKLYNVDNPDKAIYSKECIVHQEKDDWYARIEPFEWEIEAPQKEGAYIYRVVEKAKSWPSFEDYDKKVEFTITVLEE